MKGFAVKAQITKRTKLSYTLLKRVLRILGTAVAIVFVFLLIIIGLFFSPPLLAQISGRLHSASFQQGSLLRTYHVYKPSVLSQHPGLIIVLQATGGNGVWMEAITGFDSQAERLNWLVAYPDAAPGGWQVFGGERQDVTFISSLIDRLHKEYGVDLHRVFVTGASRGGMMSYRLGCDLSDKIAVIAPVAGNMADQSGNVEGANCHPRRPVSVLTIHGTADPEIPVEGGHSQVNQETVSYSPLNSVIAKWRELDGCGSQSSIQVSQPSTIKTWSCQDNTTVALRLVSGGGHAWPGGPITFMAFVNLTQGSSDAPIIPDSSFSASQVIADFFVAHSR
jgi:polyhydroxybutyrate depolymerase